MSKYRTKITMLVRIVSLWVLSILPLSPAMILSTSIERAYRRALNDYRNLKIDEKNAELNKNNIKLKNLNKKL